jgi:alginate export protein
MMRWANQTVLLWLGICLGGLIGSEALARRPSAVSGPPPPASAFPMPAPYKSQHAEEDFSDLKDPAKRGDPFDPLKYIPLVGREDWFLTLGGEARARYEYFNNRNFGGGVQDHNGYLLQRYMFFGDLHIGNRFRVFSEFKSALINFNQSPARSTDENRLDLHQAFVDFTIEPTANTMLTVRPGRQELAFGASRLVALRDAPNDRQTFDGVRLVAAGEGWRVDGIAVRPVLTRPGEFDDVTDSKTDFWGVHGVKVWSPTSKGGMNLYYFGLNREGAQWNQITGREQRQTIGARLFDRVGSWDYDIEGTFQWGSFGSGDVQAWRIAFDGGYHFSSLPLRPRPHLQIDVMSGDRRQGDQNIESFNPLFPKAHYFGVIGLLGPVNLINTHPSIDFQLTEKLRATTKIDFFWRQSVNDGVYNPAGVLFRAAGNSKATYVGSEAQVEIYWEINRHLALISNYTHFFVGQFLRETGPGKDVDYTTTWVTFRF